MTVATSVVFQAGIGGYDVYRIPAIVRTPSGILVAFAEGRHTTSDTGNVDIVARRSFDGGTTWLAQRVVTNHGSDTAGNPTVMVDPASGDIVLLSCRNGGALTEAQIMQGQASAATTRRVYVQRSADNAVTWSAPVEVTTVKDAGWRWYATGPGHGVAKQAAPHAGRLVVAANHSKPPAGSDTGTENKYYGAHSIYSDDGGVTWQVGFTSSATNGYVNENESTVAELPDGRLYFSARGQNDTAPGTRADAISVDGGQTLERAYRPQATITTPVVEGSVLALPDGRLLYSGPSHPTDRAAMAIRVSEDDGRTWTIGHQVSGLPAAYSDMVLMDGAVGVLYETGDFGPNETITFTSVPIAEIRG
ncbi:sialidase family protein [Planotetraspora phitsanulokensis]|uniref:sialidase family protein n=1 Tax=Planotetraspora phitsanulokensis TaxID=575192 RepID=UPI00194E9D3C|nr:sialidase family protein [Planotetraspora phitsanulokensis]